MEGTLHLLLVSGVFHPNNFFMGQMLCFLLLILDQRLSLNTIKDKIYALSVLSETMDLTLKTFVQGVTYVAPLSLYVSLSLSDGLICSAHPKPLSELIRDISLYSHTRWCSL